MKIQTNAGEVTLTAEMVCRGMVFQSDNWIQNHARDGVLTMLHDDPGNPGAWKATVDDSWCFPEHAQCFLGCDPTIATRAACERYGVHGDAAAHGFARLRGGGAVDLRRATPEGTVAEVPGGDRWTFASRGDGLGAGVRFLGLSAGHASPEDVRRLCCLAPQNGDIGSAVRCTLAIGDHAEHEDLATGVKWSARPNPLEHLRERAAAFVSQPAACSKCGGVDHARPGTEVTAVVESAKRAAESVRGTYSDYFGWGEPSFGARALDIMARQDESGVLGFCAFIAGLKRWAESPAGKRTTQERALVALVNAVPEGLDPIGWRAAVLGTMEQLRQVGDDGAEIRWRLTDERPEKPGSVERLIREEAYSLPLRLYQRAIAPAAKVDRVRATWKTRGPVLPCDNGEDE